MDAMTYSESAKGITITRDRALLEVRKHGANEHEFVIDCGEHTTYPAELVMEWLGY